MAINHQNLKAIKSTYKFDDCRGSFYFSCTLDMHLDVIGQYLV